MGFTTIYYKSLLKCECYLVNGKKMGYFSCLVQRNTPFSGVCFTGCYKMLPETIPTCP